MTIAKPPWSRHGTRVAALATAIVLAATAARAQQASPASSLDDLVRQAAERFARTRESGSTRAPGEQQSAAGPTRSLTIDEAV